MTDFLRSLTAADPSDPAVQQIEEWLLDVKGMGPSKRRSLGVRKDDENVSMHYYFVDSGILELRMTRHSDGTYTRETTDFIAKKADLIEMLGSSE